MQRGLQRRVLGLLLLDQGGLPGPVAGAAAAALGRVPRGCLSSDGTGGDAPRPSWGQRHGYHHGPSKRKGSAPGSKATAACQACGHRRWPVAARVGAHCCPYASTMVLPCSLTRPLWPRHCHQPPPGTLCLAVMGALLTGAPTPAEVGVSSPMGTPLPHPLGAPGVMSLRPAASRSPQGPLPRPPLWPCLLTDCGPGNGLAPFGGPLGRGRGGGGAPLPDHSAAQPGCCPPCGRPAQAAHCPAPPAALVRAPPHGKHAGAPLLPSPGQQRTLGLGVRCVW